MFENRPLYKIFSDIPNSYDSLNRLLTLGFDQMWRKKAAKICLYNTPERVLDLCCGTGDLAFKLKKYASSDTKLSGLDYSESMLNNAKKKASIKNITNIEFFHADVSDMPFPNEFFDTIGISFAFRNLTYRNPHRGQFLEEIFRVLKSNGQFVIIETSQPENKFFRKLFHIYLKIIAAPIGGILSGNYAAYKYLAHSASEYYNNEELKDLLLTAGFYEVKSISLLGGISGLHIVRKYI